MTFFKTAMTALALTCCVSALDARTAEAGTLFDLFRRKPKVVEEFPAPPVAVVAPPVEKRVAKAAPRVVGPRYYTYKAEALRRVAIARAPEASDPIVTSSVSSDTAQPVAATPSADMHQYLSTVDVRATADVAKAVETFYGQNSDFLWFNGTAINERSRAALAVLRDAGKVGLDVADYEVSVPADTFNEQDLAGRGQALVQFEVKLSAAVLSFVSDTVRGRIDPNKISGYHDFKRKSLDLVSVLDTVRDTDDISAFLKGQTPNGPEFTALQRALEELQASQVSEPNIVIAPNTLLKPGISNPEMKNVVAAIRQKASSQIKTDHAATLAAYQDTPEYTPELVALVEAFQKEHGLKADGVVGQASIRVMTGGDTAQAKINKLIIAMEQARWLPKDLGARHVFINQPAFMAYYTDAGAEQFSMRVVVGSKSNQTYFFNDEIQTVEFNPSWGVPQSIIINEMLPKLRNDPGYLDRMGYHVEVGGKKVASSAVDWYSLPKSVAVRQPPSDDNALGELKILFPNAHAIYMHDTPSKSFFNKDQRALSHGCIRLSDPRRMAAAVLGTSLDDVAKQIAGGRNKAVPLPTKIPVYVAYFTAWPNKDGVVEYFNDVYDRDSYMNKALDATKSARHNTV